METGSPDFETCDYAKEHSDFIRRSGPSARFAPRSTALKVLKIYRAIRPSPLSSIRPCQQVVFYDAGLGAGEIGGLTFRRIRNFLSAAVGTGIDENVIDCYETIISYYEPGFCVLFFGFLHGAYTVRAVTNVINLYGIPTRMPGGTPIPRYRP
ncbi:MAG: DUF2235 domain-containing protein [Pseudomonadota bacterium]